MGGSCCQVQRQDQQCPSEQMIKSNQMIKSEQSSYKVQLKPQRQNLRSQPEKQHKLQPIGLFIMDLKESRDYSPDNLTDDDILKELLQHQHNQQKDKTGQSDPPTPVMPSFRQMSISPSEDVERSSKNIIFIREINLDQKFEPLPIFQFVQKNNQIKQSSQSPIPQASTQIDMRTSTQLKNTKIKSPSSRQSQEPRNKQDQESRHSQERSSKPESANHQSPEHRSKQISEVKFSQEIHFIKENDDVTIKSIITKKSNLKKKAENNSKGGKVSFDTQSFRSKNKKVRFEIDYRVSPLPKPSALKKK